MNIHAPLAAAAALAALCAPAHALTFVPVDVGPTALQSGTQARVFATVNLETTSDNLVSTEAQARTVNERGQTASVSADLATGQTGASVALSPSGLGFNFDSVSADAKIFDVVQFSFAGAPSGEVSFSMRVDGTLSNADDVAGNDTVVIGSGQVRVFDVTDFLPAFQVFGRQGGEGNLLGANAQGFFDEDIPPFGEFVFTNSEAIVSAGLALIPASLEDDVLDGFYAIGGADEYQVDTTGEPVAFDKLLAGSYIAEAGRIYTF